MADTKNMSMNTRGGEGFGPNVASTARELVFSSNLTENGFLIEEHLGGTLLPPLTVDVLDTFGQRISAGITDAREFACLCSMWMWHMAKFLPQ